MSIPVTVAGGLYLTDRLVDHQISNSHRVSNPLIAGAAVLGTSSFFRSFIESPLDRTTEMWDHESTLAASRGSRSRRSPAAPRGRSAGGF